VNAEYTPPLQPLSDTEIELRLLMEAIYLKYSYDFRNYTLASQKRRVLHRDTIYPFFADAYTVNLHAGPHQDSLVARRAAFEAFAPPHDRDALCRLATPTQLLFPNTFLIWHPDYVSLIGMFSPAVGQVRWVHTMLIPPDRTGEDWTPHWEKTFQLIEQTVFQQEDIATAVAIQRGLSSGANTDFHLGRLEHEVLRFHRNVDDALGGTLRP